MFCFMICKQGLGKLWSLILGHIIDVKLFTAPYSSSMKGSIALSLLEDKGAPSLCSCRFKGVTCIPVLKPGALSLLQGHQHLCEVSKEFLPFPSAVVMGPGVLPVL